MLDFSASLEPSTSRPIVDIDNLIGSTRSSKLELDDIEDDDGASQATSSRGWGIFSNLIAGKVLTKDDMKEPLAQMHQFLLAKNVANEVSIHICESVENSLIGQKTGSFQSKPRHCKALLI